MKRKWDQEGQRGSGSTAVGKDLTKKVKFGKRLAGGGRQLGKEFTGTGESLRKSPKAGDGPEGRRSPAEASVAAVESRKTVREVLIRSSRRS